LLSQIKALQGIEHRVMYYGPKPMNELAKSLQDVHCTTDKLQKVEPVRLSSNSVEEPGVLFAQYDAKQIYYMQYSCREQDKFNVKNSPIAELYNNYFSGGMNSVVFQEMREARGLAYSAYAGLWKGKTPKDPYYFYAFIATQNDKLQQAVEAFDEIIEDMPRSDKAFDLAKSGILANLESKRTTKANILWSYLDYEKFGLKEDINKTVYEGVKNLSLDDVVKFQQEFIKGRPYTYCILGDRNDLDMKYLRSLGKIKFLSQEEIFGC
jgi:predicted Zn-dependent peptidase